jgi:Uma2 family endonuclease
MAIVIDEAFLSATLTSAPMTDEQFAEFCSEHPDLCFEMTAEDVIIVRPPAYSLAGSRNQEIGRQLSNLGAGAARRHRKRRSWGFRAAQWSAPFPGYCMNIEGPASQAGSGRAGRILAPVP